MGRKSTRKKSRKSHVSENAPSSGRKIARPVPAAQVVKVFADLLTTSGAFEEHALSRLKRSKTLPRLTEAGRNAVEIRAVDLGLKSGKLIKIVERLHLRYLSDVDADIDIPANRALAEEISDAYSRDSTVKEKLRTMRAPIRQSDVDALLELPPEQDVRKAIAKRQASYVSIHQYLRDLEYTEVPPYQRRYVWKEKQLEDLFRDLDRGDTRDLESPVHFVGTVLLKDKGASTYQILDGQQRTMTFCLFVAVSCRLLRKWGSWEYARDLACMYLAVAKGKELSPKFRPSPADQCAFKDLLSKAIDARAELSWNWPEGAGWTTQQSPRVSKAARFIEEKLSFFAGSESQEKRKSLVLDVLHKLLYKCAVCKFSLHTTDDALVTFRTLNSTGHGLENADILKAVACRLSGTDHAKFVDDVWEPINRSVCLGGEDPKWLDLFYSAYAKWWLETPVTKQEVVDRLSESWEKVGDIDPIVGSLKLAAPLFNATTNFGARERTRLVGEERLNKEELGWLWILSTAGLSQEIVPFVMLQLQRRLDQKLSAKESIEALEFLGSLTVRRGVQLSQSLQGLQKYMSKAIKDLRLGKKSPREILIDCLDTPDQKLSQFTDDAFEAHLNLVPLARKRELARAILYRLDLDQQPYDDARDRTGHKTRAIDQVEHVCPQELENAESWEHIWKKDDHGDWVHRLGNIVLLEPPENQGVGRKPLDEKIKRFLKGSNVTMTIELGAKLKSDPRWPSKWKSQWGVELVRDRTADLAQLAVKAFPFPFVGRKH